MTEATALALVTSDADADPSGGRVDRVEALRSLVRPEFLDEMWDAELEAFAPPRDHPLLGLRKCAVVDCDAGVRSSEADLCKVCAPRFKTSGLSLEKFAAISCNRVCQIERRCRVPGCARPSDLRVALCITHYKYWRRTDLTAEAFAASPDVSALPGFGSCAVRACCRVAGGGHRLCSSHWRRWRAIRRDDPRRSYDRWLWIAEPINPDHLVILKGLSAQVQLEVLLGLQERVDAGTRTLMTALRPIVEILRRTEAASIDDLDETLIKPSRRDAAQLGRWLRTAVRRRLTSPAQERVNDVWDLAVFGLAGRC